MARYVAMAVSDEIEPEDREQPPTMTVHSDGDGPIDTGLVDSRGVKIYRVRERVAFGFHASR